MLKEKEVFMFFGKHRAANDLFYICIHRHISVYLYAHGHIPKKKLHTLYSLQRSSKAIGLFEPQISPRQTGQRFVSLFLNEEPEAQ